MTRRKLKIAYLLSSFPQISETFILNQITGLLDLGHEVEIFSEKRPDSFCIHQDVIRYQLLARTKYLRTIPVSKFRLRIKAFLASCQALMFSPSVVFCAISVLVFKWRSFTYEDYFWAIDFAKFRKRYDILMCHYGMMGNRGALLKEIGVHGKLCVMFHGYDIRTGIAQGGNIYRRLFDRADAILSISDYNYRHLVQFGANPEKIIYHPVGIDVDKFRLEGRAQTTDKSLIRIVTVARLVEEKGIEYAIEGLRILRERRPDLKFEYHIYGSGGLHQKLMRLIVDCGQEKHIFLQGEKKQEELPLLFSQADIFLLPSRVEALPVCLMEAGACALPVVATDVGSIREIVVDGETGCLVPSADPRKIAEKIEFFIEKPKEGKRMGQNARKYVSQHYNIKTLNQKLSDLFQKLSGSRNN